MIRSFIAITIPCAIQTAIADQTASLRNAFGKPVVSWVPSQNIHLTMKFLGDISSEHLDSLVRELTAEVLHHEVFSFSVGGNGVFPNVKRPRVVWIGIDTPQALMDLYQHVEDIADRSGYPKEQRLFSPHLTIGRVNQHLSNSEADVLGKALAQFKVGKLGTVTVDSLQVFKSDLKPTGAVYTNLHTIHLARSS